MALISAAVGKDGKNRPKDVKTVQRLLNKHSLPPLRALTVDGKAGANTVGAIEHFQTVVVKMKSPDGRVDPGGKTIRHLNRGPAESKPNQNGSANDKSIPNTGPAAGANTASNLSGTKWWRANQKRYPNSRRLENLNGDFKGKVTRFVAAMQAGGATVSVGSTLRNKIRAHLMHYSWRIAKMGLAPAQVPNISGLNIHWDHGNLAASQKGARQMVSLFNMAYNASVTSNHIKGLAIDMTITWKGDLTLKVPGQQDQVTIQSGPRNGAQNHQLHQVGREFGVKKLFKDKPHWSFNGK